MTTPRTVSKLPHTRFNDLAQFFKFFFPEPTSYGSGPLFKWKIINNTFGEGLVNAILDNERIASTASITLKEIYFKGEKQLCAEIGDTYTHPDFRNQGLFAMLINQCRKDANDKGISFVYGTPNANSLPGYQKKANFQIIPGDTIEALLLPLKLGKYLKKKKVPGVFIPPVSIMYDVFTSFYFKKDPLLKALNVDTFLNEKTGFEEFWAEARKDYDFILNRDVSSLKWRFFDHPDKYQLYLFKDGAKVIGYIVTKVRPMDGEPRLVLADFLFLKGYDQQFKKAVSAIIHEAAKSGHGAVETWVMRNSPYYKELKQLRFMNYHQVNLICHINESTQSLTRTSGWHFTISDSDNI